MWDHLDTEQNKRQPMSTEKEEEEDFFFQKHGKPFLKTTELEESLPRSSGCVEK